MGDTFLGRKGLMLFPLFLFPEKVEKFSVLFWKIIYFLAKRGEKRIIAHDLQAGVNEFSKSLKREIFDFEPRGINIQWITEKEPSAEFFKKDKLIIRMRPHTEQDKNFVNTSIIFIIKVLFRKSKKYLSPGQRESFDLFIARKLFERERPRIVNQFFENYFSQKTPLIASTKIIRLTELGQKYKILDKVAHIFPKLPLWIQQITFLGIKTDQFFEDYYSRQPLSSNKIMELMRKYGIIDKAGLFFPILVQELNILGEKVFYYKFQSDKIISEITVFINFLKRYAEREEREEGEAVPENFEGEYCRCGVVIMEGELKRKMGDLAAIINYIKKLAERKYENIYLVGLSSKEDRDFITQISKAIQKKFRLQKFRCKSVKRDTPLIGYQICYKT